MNHSDFDRKRTWTESELDISLGEEEANESNVTFCDSDFDFDLEEADFGRGLVQDVDGDSACNSSISYGPSTSTPLKKQRRTTKLSPLETLQKGCCRNYCLRALSERNITQCMEEFSSLSEVSQRNFIIDQIHTHAQTETEKWKQNLVLNIRGNYVCEKAWCMAYSVSKTRFDKCTHLVKEGFRSSSHGNSGKHHVQSKTTEAMGWMDNFFHSIGDYMPHKSVIYLPPTWDRKQVYQRMVADFEVSRKVTRYRIVHYRIATNNTFYNS